MVGKNNGEDWGRSKGFCPASHWNICKDPS
jgi:hypothetical protein